MEFKGTKGKWYKSYRNGSWLIQDYDTFIEDSKGCISEVYYFNDGEDTAEANALLISKSPILLQAIYDSIKPLRDAGLKEMADYHEKIYIESINL